MNYFHGGWIDPVLIEEAVCNQYYDMSRYIEKLLERKIVIT